MREYLPHATLTVILVAALLGLPAPALSADEDPEIGANDFRISDMGPDGNTSYFAANPAVAFNPSSDEYLVIWSGDDDTGSLVDNEFEIFGQRIDATTGDEIGNDFRISSMGPDGNASYGAFRPAVAYNPSSDEYLVVWDGDDDTGSLIQGEVEIFGQRLDATGAEVGSDDFRISDMGPDSNTLYGAFAPAVAYNPSSDEYLVVWDGDDDTGSLIQGEFEIFGQRLDAATGAEVGGDFRMSSMGPDGDADYDASDPAVAFNPSSDEYLVVWRGDDDTGSLIQGEFEIFGQRIDATGAEVGADDFRISSMGPDGNTSYSAVDPAVAYNPSADEYLVVWHGDDDTGSLIQDEVEIFGQRLDATGAEAGSDDFRISDMGLDRKTSYFAANPAVAYDPAANQYLVVWWGDDDTPPLIDGEFEIFGQRLRFHVPHDVGLVDTSQGLWYLRDHKDASVTTFFFGNPGDRPVVGDWDGSGDETPGLFRSSDGFFYGRNSNDAGIADFSCFAGNPSDIALGGDWDGDGIHTLGIYRPSQQVFYLYNKSCVGNPGPPMGAAGITFLFGNPGDTPAVGDFDGDGNDEVGLYRESTGFFYWRDTLTTGIADGEMFFGNPGDRFVAGDWGLVDATDTPAVFRPSNTTFFFRHTLTPGVADSQFVFGEAPWQPVSGKFGLG